MRRIEVVALCLGLLIADVGYSANRFFDDGTSGVDLGAAYIALGVTGFGMGLGYTIDSRFDLGIDVFHLDYDITRYGWGVSSTEFTPSIAISAIRPTDTSIAGLDFFASYSFGPMSSEPLDAFESDISGDAYRIGSSMYLKLRVEGYTEFYPSFGFFYSGYNATIKDRFGNTVDELAPDINIEFAARLSILINNAVYIDPVFSSFDGEARLTIRVGLVLPTAVN